MPNSEDQVLVVIGRAGSLDRTATNTLRQWGAPQPSWLGDGEALEVGAFTAMEEAALALRTRNWDTAIVPLPHRKKRLLLADMDSTMIQQECIDELGVIAGVGNHIKDITARSMRGELDFEEALTERVALLRGLPESVIAEVIERRISFMPGGKTLLATMKANGAYAALVSGGFTAFTSHVAGQLGFDENHANTLLVKDGKLTGEVALPILGKNAKVESLKRICAARQIAHEDVLAVGDGANDIPMLLAAGMGVALHAKPRVQEQARYVINHGDLTALLYLQGYRKTEFKNG